MKEQIKNTFIKVTGSENDKDGDKQEMLAFFHRPENEFEVKEVLLEELINEVEAPSGNIDLKTLFYKIWKKIENEQKQQNSKKRYLKFWTKIAAAIIIGLMTGIFATTLKKTHIEPVYYEAHSPKGSVSQLLMPDSTLVFLNADSRVRYNIESKNKTREVYLEGEAWFDVAKNKKKPFIVHTPYYDVRVTGTQFNIKAYKSDRELTTTLEEGQIIIGSTENFCMAKDIIVKPGEQVILDKDSRKISIRKVNTQWYTSWKDNKLVFVNMNMGELVVLLERKYGVDIEVNDKNILKLHFDGTIKNESIIELLEIIKHALPIDYKIVGQKIKITSNKNQ